jgi:hypothetical protein
VWKFDGVVGALGNAGLYQPSPVDITIAVAKGLSNTRIENWDRADLWRRSSLNASHGS